MSASRSAPRPAAQDTAKSPIRKTLRSFRRVFFVVFFFSFFINILALVTPFYMLQVYDRVLTSGSKDTLYALTVLAIALLAANAVLDFMRGRIMVRLGNRMDADLAPNVFSAAFRRRVEAPEAGGAQALRDVEAVRSFMTGPGFLAFFDAPWIPAFIGLIFLFHPWLGLIAAAGAAALFLLAILSELATRWTVRKGAEQGREAYGFVEQALRNAEAAQAMGMAARLRGSWQRKSLAGVAHNSRAADRSAFLSAIAKFIRPSLQIAILGVGAFLALEQQISPGVMIAASIVMGRALAPVEASIAHWRNFVASRAARKRLDALLEAYEPLAPRMALPAPRGRVSVEAVTAAPPQGGKPVLVNITFAVEAGELVAIAGPSASGKSSLVRLLVGVWRPSVGHVRLDGAELQDWDAAQLGRLIGYVPQDVELFEGTVAENIARFEEAEPEAVVAAAQLAGAHEAILELAEAYETRVGEGGAALSGGQRQRVALARALYGDPRLIVLDEPDANLDDAGRAALAAALERLRAEGRTVFLVSHRAQSLGVGPGKVDRLILMERGRARVLARRREAAEAAGARVVDLAEKKQRPE